MSKSTTPKRKRKPSGWIAVSTTSMPDPRVVPADAARRVVVTQLIDDRGRHFERWGDEAPVLVGKPPAANDDGA